MRLSFWFTCAALFGSWAAFASAEAPQSARDAILELRQAQQQLAADFGAFSATHAQDAPEARQQALIEFQKRTQSRVEGLWLKARVMARANAAFETPLIWQVEIPENASAAMEESLVQRAQIVNQLATISNAMRAAPPEQKQAVMEEWQEKSQSVLAAFRAQVTQVADEERQKPLPLPPPARIPNDASAKLRNFLTQRDAQIRQSVDFENALRNLTPEQQSSARREHQNQLSPGKASVLPDTAAALTSPAKPKP